MNYSKSIKRTDVAKRIIASWLIIALLFGATGFVFGRISVFEPVKEPKVTMLPTERVDEEVVAYGANKADNGEVKQLDWNVPSDFKPLNVNMDEELQEFTYSICKAYNLDFSFVMAIIQNESGYQADVISTTNDYGLMQINEQNFASLSEVTGVTDFLDPKQNIVAGTYILHELFKKYDDPHRVLMSYNMGEYQATNLWENGIYSSEYSRKITEIQDNLNNSEENSNESVEK